MTAQISDIALHLRNGKSVQQSPSAGGLPVTRIETIAKGVVDPYKVGFAGLDESQCSDWLLEEGDILISHINSKKHLAKCAIYEGRPSELVHGMNLLALRPDPCQAFPKYILHALKSSIFLRQIPSITKNSVNQASFNISNFKSLRVPLPPLAEQKRIAAILNAADELRAKRREAIAQLDVFLQSTFIEMFGDPVTNPKGWEIVALGDRSEKITKGQSPKWQGFEYQENGVLFVTSENVRNGYLDISKKKFVPHEFNAKIKSSQIFPGDLLVNLVGASIGRSCLFAGFFEEANVNQAVGVVRLNDPCFSNYVLHLLQTEQGKTLLTRNVVEAARANISLKNLRELEVPYPPRDLQRHFSAIAESFEQQKAKMRAHLAELDALFASLQHRAFNGEL